MKILFPLAALTALTAVAGELPARFNGLSGAPLRAAVAADFAPITPALEAVDMKGGSDVSGYFDVFSGSTVDAARWRYGMIVPQEWMATEALVDMYNVLRLSDETDAVRRDLPLGKVDEATYDNGIWRAGTAAIAGLPVSFYEPPTDFRGDFARVFFYYVAVHSPVDLTPRGYMMLDGNVYPAFTPYAQATLMEYHRADPVSDDERRRMEVIAAKQGNRNPFVLYPELAEYLWGDRANEPVVIPGAPSPLRGTYALGDEKIDLVSEYIPDDAEWTVDGKKVTESYLVPSRLGLGNHSLRFTSPSGTAGMLTIRIVE